MTNPLFKDTAVTADNLENLTHVRFDGPGEDDTDHPMTAVGVVLLAAGPLGITDPQHLSQFTGYEQDFVSAIIFNLQNNKLWAEGHYDYSGWLSSDGSMKDHEFWDHIRAACGELLYNEADPDLAVSICLIY